MHLRLLALKPRPQDAQYLRDRLERAAASASALQLEALAIAVIEIDGGAAIDRLVSLYAQEARSPQERAAVTSALGNQAIGGERALRDALVAALLAMMRADAALAPAVAHTFAAIGEWGHADRFFALIAQRALVDPRDGFAVASYVALARSKAGGGPVASATGRSAGPLAGLLVGTGLLCLLGAALAERSGRGRDGGKAAA